MATLQDVVRLDPDAAEALGRRLLQRHGVLQEDATIVAQCLVRADLRGIDPHGLPDLFVGREDYRAGIDRLVERVRTNPPALGFSEVVMPGALEARLEQAGDAAVRAAPLPGSRAGARALGRWPGRR
jgi:LDH2 family malate/lactate/ureidoglycolate dehydrogenase